LAIKKLTQVKELLKKQQEILRNPEISSEERENISKELTSTLSNFIDFLKQNPSIVHEYPDLINDIQRLASENKALLEKKG